MGGEKLIQAMEGGREELWEGEGLWEELWGRGYAEEENAYKSQ